MYISVETRDALCEAGVWAICLYFGVMALAIGLPWLHRKTAIKRRIMVLQIKLFIAKAKLKYSRYRAVRRYKAAMKVFDKPVRWEEK